MRKKYKEKLEKAKLLSFSQEDIDRQKKFKGKKKKKKASKVTASPEHKKMGAPVTAEELNDTISRLLKVKP